MLSDLDHNPGPKGELSLQTVAMPKDTNAAGDIFGGWLMSQMDLAAAISASAIAQGRVATVAVDKMSFMVPVKVGSVISCYTDITSIGRSSIQVQVEVWMAIKPWADELIKVTDGTFVFVAIDDNGRTRSIPS
jgi:acyl-CoA thioesterase YciA